MEPPETYAGADGTTEEEGGEMLGENIGWCRLVSFQPFHFQEIISCKVAEKNEEMRTLQERIWSLEAKAGQDC